ncbi:PrsW family intramembrane metalloprotease [Cellulosimicrobium cellulans]|uniref:PrsW family intramembrane metalloprotease n=1 Tax=Cellulosimicrobium cellulans TaxID=1710 RepID=UPI001EDA6455|nr:PrsW family intramembrane metalloprotease [Cellulosimicrobium cellulans]
MTYPPHGPAVPPPHPQQTPVPPHPQGPAGAAVPLDPRAVLEGRPPGRARVGVIVTIAVASLCLLVGLVLAALSGVGTFTVGLLLALVPLGIWVPVVLALDRLEPEPPSALVVAFLWGAGIATLVAGILNTLGLELLTAPLFGEEVGWYVVASFGAPFVEEILKGAVLFGMLWFRRHEIDGWTDGVIYAAMVALGFAAVENVTYFIMAAQDGTLGPTFVLRALVTPLLHPLCTALTGLGVASAATSPPGPRRVLAPIGGLAAAIALHMLWNASTGFGPLALGVAYLAGLGVLITLIVLLVRDRRRTVATIQRQLVPYVPTGLVTPADLTMLSTLASRRQARDWARRTGGAGAAHAMRDYQQAATELALLHDRVARGAVEAWRVEGQRRALLQLMLTARQAFLVRTPQPPPAPWSPGTPSGFTTDAWVPGQGAY